MSVFHTCSPCYGPTTDAQPPASASPHGRSWTRRHSADRRHRMAYTRRLPDSLRLRQVRHHSVYPRVLNAPATTTATATFSAAAASGTTPLTSTTTPWHPTPKFGFRRPPRRERRRDPRPNGASSEHDVRSVAQGDQGCVKRSPSRRWFAPQPFLAAAGCACAPRPLSSPCPSLPPTRTPTHPPPAPTPQLPT